MKKVKEKVRGGERAVAATTPPLTISAGESPALSAEDELRRARKGRLFVIIFAVAVILLLIGGLVYLHWSRAHTAAVNQYNGFDFTQVQDGKLMLWATRIEAGGQPYIIPFYYHPRDVEQVAFQQGLTERFLTLGLRPQRIYITFAEDAGSIPVIGGVEISRITGYQNDLVNIDTRGALQTSPSSNATNVEVVRCADATANVSVLSFDLGGNDSIYQDAQDPYCIHFEYTSPNESIRVADRFAYGLVGIMPG